MNEQKSPGGIEWTRIKNKDGTFRRGYTWNPITGCLHDCRWNVGGKQIICYAEDVAENSQAKQFYPEGFAYYYYQPKRLQEPIGHADPAGIFWGSMTDNFGHWVKGEDLDACMKTIKATPQHIYFALTKNPKRMANYRLADANPADNVWWGASSPPDHMNGKELTQVMQVAMLDRTLFYLSEIHRAGGTTWMSAEPLSWDISSQISGYYGQGDRPLDWIVIGAASDGPRYTPPNEVHVKNLLATGALYGIRVFYKGNMKCLPFAKEHWYEEFPDEPS